MFLLFGKSMNAKVRLLIGIAALVIGIVLHLALVEILGGAYLAFAAFMLVRDVRRNIR
jgi:threonine/homoserine/homoserine lactone efflux protein